MDVASGGLNLVQASKLRQVKDIRERSALRELSNMEARLQTAINALQRACESLKAAENRRAKVEAELYQELASLETMSVTELDRRCQLVLGRLAAEIESTRQEREQAHIAHEQAQQAVNEARNIWAKRSTASQKWQEIEGDVQRTTALCSEFAAEIEADDEVLLRYKGGSRCQAVGSSN
ncbi:flagellar biosynthesis chaperone FliJ [Bradyrhizobium sp. USDA 4472]